MLQLYRGLQKQRVYIEQIDHVEEPLKSEGVEVYEEYVGSQVGKLRHMKGTGPHP